MCLFYYLTRALPLAGALALALLVSPLATRGQEAIFSGPQIGEKLPPLKMKLAFGERAGQEIEFVQSAEGKPILLIFFHARTRPAFGLTRAIAGYAASKAKDGLQTAVIFLTDDQTAEEKWLKVTEKQFPTGVTYGISPDGLDGPGAYGLNRNVTLTVLVGNEGKVTENSALVQPQLQADGPKILKAIVAVTGGGEVPSIEDIGGDRYGDRSSRMQANMREGNDAKLTELLRPMINKQATAEAVAKAAEQVEEYVAGNEKAKADLSRIVATILDSGKIDNYGTEPARDKLREWSQKYPAQEKAQR